MPLRPELPSGFSLSRRSATPVKLPKMHFPLMGMTDGAGAQATEAGDDGTTDPTAELTTEPTAPPVEQLQPGTAINQGGESPMIQTPSPAPQAPTPLPQISGTRVIVYGRSGCPACVEAIGNLIDQQISFSYYDVGRDTMAMNHVQAICGGSSPMVPVIIQIGYTSGA